MNKDFARNTPLGKSSKAVEHYSPSLLCPLPRQATRTELGLEAEHLPFTGVDFWTLYEVSWLNQKGVPMVAVGQLEVPCDSGFLIESKSLKLYLNSFNQSRFASAAEVARTIEADLAERLDASIEVKLVPLAGASSMAITNMAGNCLDALDVSTERYEPAPDLLYSTAETTVEDCLYSDLFRSCCPVTGQPDWASVSIAYRGQPINREGLLKYLISYRGHSGFHEQCVERIFVDVLARCQIDQLTVYARFLRRGGIDINPYRTNSDGQAPHGRLIRQ